MEANNEAAIAKALEYLCSISDLDLAELEMLGKRLEDTSTYGGGLVLKLVHGVRNGQKALAKPPRNCDVGIPDEQSERFKNFCRNHQFISVDSEDGFPPVYVCSNESCPLHGYYIVHGEDNCELAWAQMPYESQNSKG